MKNILFLLLLISSYSFAQVNALNDRVRSSPPNSTFIANALDAGGAFTAASTDNYTVSTGLNPYSSGTYAEGDTYKIIFTNANTVTNPTINFDAEGAVDIVDNKGDPVGVGDVEGVLTIMYVGSDFRIVGGTGSGGGGTPGGADTQVQYNDSGAFGGEADMTYNESTNTLTVDNAAVDTEAYDATGWNGDLTVPTKDATRDIIETLGRVAQRIDQNNASTTSAQLATTLSDETGTGVAVYSASPALTGTPTAPTAAQGTNTTQLATTAFVQTAIAAPPLVIYVTDVFTNIGAGTGKMYVPIKTARTITSVTAYLITAQASGSIFTVDINENGSSILSPKLTIDNTETNSTTAATAATIVDSSLAANSILSFDVDQIGNGTAIGLIVIIE